MKKFLISILGLFLFGTTNSQPWMPTTTTGLVKLKDIIEQYEANKPKTEKPVNGRESEEGTDYLFERWAYYWQQHLDSVGNMVPDLVTYNEWNSYLKSHIKENTANKTTFTLSDWQFQGPDASHGGYAGIGRINTMAFDPVDSSIFYVGSAGGGAWKTIDGGSSWTAMYNNLATFGVSDIKVNPLNGNTIYICTGDKDGHDNFSIGVLKSYDGGATWFNTGLSWSVSNYFLARSLLINPVDTNSLILATSVGIYKTYNGGDNWFLASSGNFEQILYNPADTQIMYGTNYGSGSSAQILRSLNGGVTWTTCTSLINVQRINIATTPAKPELVMAIAASTSSGLSGIYCSVNSGVSYAATYTNDAGCTKNLLSWDFSFPTTTCGGQGWYDLCITIDPVDYNKVIIGGVNHYYSHDAGYTWQLLTQWWEHDYTVNTVHADKHWLGFNPLNNKLFATCDGGIYSSKNPYSGTWTDLTNGLGITEFYRIAIADGVNFCLGGAQDNGTKKLDHGTYTDVEGGDGMQCQINYNDPANTWYAGFPNGPISRTTNGGLTWSPLPISDTGNWLTPYIIHPSNDNMVLAGYKQLKVSLDKGDTWDYISPQFSSGFRINNIAVPFTNPTYIYLVLDDNTIRFTPDFGANWSILPPHGSSAQISRITCDPKDENKLWVTFSGFIPGSKVYMFNRTTNTWTHFTGSLPNIPVNCIVIDSATETQYIGTETTVFYKDTTMTDWALYNNNLPTAIVNDLKINYSAGELWAGTYGRGVWKTTKADGVNFVTSEKYNNSNIITVNPVPNNGNFVLQTSNNKLFGENAIISITSPDGRTVWKKNMVFNYNGKIEINTNNLPAGIYLCKVASDGFLATAKIVIE